MIVDNPIKNEMVNWLVIDALSVFVVMMVNVEVLVWKITRTSAMAIMEVKLLFWKFFKSLEI
jgi:hypothetical protein